VAAAQAPLLRWCGRRGARRQTSTVSSAMPVPRQPGSSPGRAPSDGDFNQLDALAGG
jgi:hypothetical protein